MAIRVAMLASAAAFVSISGTSTAWAQDSVLSVPLPQSIVSVLVGNGVQQGAPVASVPTATQPLIGVGALSGGPDHYGTLLTISALNTGRLLGVDGPGGFGAPTSISVPNPRQAPILSPAK